MFYNVKLSNDSINTLREMIGVENARINLKTGIIQVGGIEDLKKIAKRFSIDNVDYKPYEEVVQAVEPVPEVPVENTPTGELTLEERREIVGYDLNVGTVIRVRGEKGTVHAVIVAARGNKFDVAELKLAEVKPEEDHDSILIPLRKGTDIVYKNTTYRDVVTLRDAFAFDLEQKDFMKGAGGMVVGKVTNLMAIQPIIDAAAENYAEELEDAEQPRKGIDFLKVIEESDTLDELFAKLGVASDILKQAATECIETGRSNVKKLIPVLQSKYDKAYGRLTQTAIKSKMNDEIKEWCEKHDVDMEECSISYFLKSIVKGLKKS